MEPAERATTNLGDGTEAIAANPDVQIRRLSPDGAWKRLSNETI